jgi:hypothetical protein
MKTILKEQVSQNKIDLIQGRDVYQCPFLIGAESGPAVGGKQVMRRIAKTDSPKGNYIIGDSLFIKDDYTYDVVRDKKLVKSNLKWVCSTLNKDVVLPQISADQMKSVDDLIAKYPGMYQKETPTADQLKTGEWKKINLKDTFPEQFKFDYIIYEKGGLRQTKSPQQEKIITTYVNRDWKDLGGKINPAEEDKYETLDLRDEYPTEFSGSSYLLARPIESADTNTLFQEMTAFVLSKNFGDRKSCKKGINTYFTLWKKSKNGEKIPVDRATLKNWKLAIDSCDVKVKNFMDFNLTNNRLKKMKENSTTLGLGSNKEEGLVDTQTDIQIENFTSLKNIVRKSLLEAKELKKKRVLTESEIVKNRFFLIAENINFNTKKGQKKFSNDLMFEMIYLNKQGFSQEIINEQFWDMIKGLFGHGGDAIMQTFKESIGKFILDILGVDANGWIGGTIVKALGNVQIGDIPKLTECNFLTGILSKSIAEQAIDKMKNAAGMEGKFYDLLRNSLVEVLEDSELGQKIENAIGSVICPLLGGVKQKMELAATDMKQKVLS